MDENQESYNNIWDMLLSRQPSVIVKGYESIELEQREAVLVHLQRMVEESEWQPEQRISAQSALNAIAGHKD